MSLRRDKPVATDEVCELESRQARFLRLQMRHERALAGMARAMLPDWGVVDEVLQEAFLVIWRKLDELQEDAQFLPWARVILRFEVLRQRRNYSRDRLVLDADLVTQMFDEDAAEAADTSVVDRRQALQGCLQQLSCDHRELVLAPYVDGAVSRLAAETQRTPNAIYKQLGRLRRQLQRCVTQKLAGVG